MNLLTVGNHSLSPADSHGLSPPPSRPAFRHRSQQVRGSGCSRCPGGAQRRHEHDGVQPDEDRQRHPLPGLRASLRPRGADPARERAGQQHHARYPRRRSVSGPALGTARAFPSSRPVSAGVGPQDLKGGRGRGRHPGFGRSLGAPGDQDFRASLHHVGERSFSEEHACRSPRWRMCTSSAFHKPQPREFSTGGERDPVGGRRRNCGKRLLAFLASGKRHSRSFDRRT